jgi:hypothetical protein
MKKAKYLKTLCCTMTEDMYLKIMKFTDEKEIGISDFIRDSIDLKFKMEENINGNERNI